MAIPTYGTTGMIPSKMVQQIMECITIVSNSLLISSGLISRFQARKRLRQGDPMSPYYDLIMCCRADKISIQLLLDKFNHFSKVSGLMASLDKSSIYVAGVSQGFKDMITSDYQFKLEGLPFKYLGDILMDMQPKLLKEGTDCLGQNMYAYFSWWTKRLTTFYGRTKKLFVN
ncbi:uncharacterized protein [Nicotiana sylvestris]|uniref:uncharacterized protein n=1 Tax=Nicotiana sylvestris TaxID=4096 RepID=UPI00388C70F9